MARLKPIKKCELFSHLSFGDVGILAHKFVEKKAVPNQWIARKGDPSNGLIIISTGKFEMTLEDQTHKEELNPFDYFGELSIVQRETRGVGVKCVVPGDFLLLSQESFHDLMKEHPEVGGKVAQAVAESVSKKMKGIRDWAEGLTKENENTGVL